jgi:hypothetical protein
MQPTQSQVHVDRPLTNASTAYMQSNDKFIATRVAPIVPVEKQTDKITVYNKNDFLRDEAQKRADGTESAGSGYGLNTTGYSCDVFALHKDIVPTLILTSIPIVTRLFGLRSGCCSDRKSSGSMTRSKLASGRMT